MESSIRKLLDSYPGRARSTLMRLRELIVQVAGECDAGPLQESLKWGEPSYTVAGGSPVRIDWKASSPDCCFVFFQCQTRLVETFRELYPQELQYDGNRAIVIALECEVPNRELRHCISLALRYHRLKHLPMLGA